MARPCFEDHPQLPQRSSLTRWRARWRGAQVELRLDGLWERNHLGEKGFGDLQLGGSNTTEHVACGALAQVQSQ